MAGASREWPDLDRVATAASLHQLLRALSEDAPKEDQNALRRAAGVVARTPTTSSVEPLQM
jgi:hypothetical protein